MFKAESKFEGFLFHGEFENFRHYNKSGHNIVFQLEYMQKKVCMKNFKRQCNIIFKQLSGIIPTKYSDNVDKNHNYKNISTK